VAKEPSDPAHCWLVWRKAHEAASDYLYTGIEETGISDTDFRVLEALLHKGPLSVNTIGPKVHLTPRGPSAWRSIACSKKDLSAGWKAPAIGGYESSLLQKAVKT
jgi:hypothetical protein